MRTGGIALIAMLMSVACTSSGESDAEQAPTDTADNSTFPVTIEHALGSIVIERAPERVVALGYNDLAVADALGAEIVGAVQNFDPDDPNLPYLGEPLPPEVLNLSAETLELELITAHRPDLILATSSYLLDPDSYGKLSEIAPVLAYQESLFGSPIEQDALLIGRALGNEAGAQALVAKADATVADFTGELPGLEGRTYLFGQARGEVIPLVIGEDNQSTQFMAKLGLRIPDELAGRPASADLAPGTIGISYEESALLDTADVLFMTFPGEEDRQRFETNPVIQQLSVLREGRYQATELEVAQFLQSPNVVGIAWLLEQIGPTLRQVGA